MKNRLSVILTVVVIAVAALVFFPGETARSASGSTLLIPGEDLLYEVSVLGIKLGSIRVVTEGVQTLNGKPVFKTKGYIDTYKGIPFVDLHTIFESWIDTSVMYSYKFNGHWKDKVDGREIWDFNEILFDYQKGEVFTSKWKEKQNFFNKTYKSKKRWNDGLSLLYFARRFANATKGVRVPTIVDKDTVSTDIKFSGKRQNVEIDAVDYPVKTIYLDGVANWTGIYGLKGSFQGWFSDDEARIPIKAKMNVYVGSINIELIKWKRTGWAPPKSK